MIFFYFHINKQLHYLCKKSFLSVLIHFHNYLTFQETPASHLYIWKSAQWCYHILVLNDCNIDGGAGEIIIDESDITNMDLDMGVGKVELNSKLNGNSEINAGVGEVDLELMGSLDDYSFKVFKGLGNITVDDHKISNDTVYGNGLNKVKISGGVGDINVTLKN